MKNRIEIKNCSCEFDVNNNVPTCCNFCDVHYELYSKLVEDHFISLKNETKEIRSFESGNV